MSRAASLLLTVLATLATAPGRAEVEGAAIDHIVVLPFNVASGLDKKQGQVLDEVYLAELGQLKPEGVRLVGSSDVSAMLGFEQQKQLAGCDETACLVEIGNALGATHIVVPSLGKFGEQFIVSSKFLDVTNGRVLHRKVLYVDGSEAAALAGVRQSVHELAVALGWQATGTAPALADQGAAPAATAGEDGAMSPLLIAGVALAGLGGLTALGLGIGAGVVDGSVGDPAASWDDRQAAAETVVGLAIGSGVGALVLVAGGVLTGVALAGE